MYWISVKDRLPNDKEVKRSRCSDFLCNILIPEKGGGVSTEYRVLRFNCLDKCWRCEEMIVTHWANIEPPKEEQHGTAPI